MQSILSTVFSLGMTIVTCSSYASSLTYLSELVENTQRQHTIQTSGRILGWDNLISDNQDLAVHEKLQLVNDFFNRIRYKTDQNHWGTEDYWATPIELLATNGGDCEDYSIAKYFTLRALGIPDTDMRLTYVNAVELNQAHMVLTYYGDNENDPLVLDNLIPRIRSVSQRSDLEPVYSFNAEGLWLTLESGRGQLLGNANELYQWRDLLRRLPRKIYPKPH